MYKEMKTITEILEKLKEEHYIHDLEYKGGVITSPSTNEEFNPDDLIIESSYRYEGDSDPSDNAVVYSVTAKSGTKGVLVDSYGAYADPELAKIIGEIPLREEHSLQDNMAG